MASIITLDGVGATNEWGEQTSSISPAWGALSRSFLGYGVVAFALGTAVLRARSALRRRGVAGWRGRRR